VTRGDPVPTLESATGERRTEKPVGGMRVKPWANGVVTPTPRCPSVCMVDNVGPANAGEPRKVQDMVKCRTENKGLMSIGEKSPFLHHQRSRSTASETNAPNRPINRYFKILTMNRACCEGHRPAQSSSRASLVSILKQVGLHVTASSADMICGRPSSCRESQELTVN